MHRPSLPPIRAGSGARVAFGGAALLALVAFLPSHALAALDAGDGSGGGDSLGDVCVATEDGSGAQCFDLIAGQRILAGSVCVWVEGDDLAVTYATSAGFELTEAHLWIGAARDGYPRTRQGNPVPGAFPYSSGDVTGATSYAFLVPLAELTCDTAHYMAAHAALQMVGADGAVLRTETGWSAGERMVARGNWATLSSFAVDCDCAGSPSPPVVVDGDMEPKITGGSVRWRRSNTGGEFFLGAGDLGVGSNRVEAEYPPGTGVSGDWADGTYAVTFAYDPAAGLTASVKVDDPADLASTSLAFPADRLVLPDCHPADWDRMVISVRADGVSTTSLQDIVLAPLDASPEDGFAIGDAPLTAPDPGGFAHRNVLNYDFASGFVVTARLVVTGWQRGSSAEAARAEIGAHCPPPAAD